MDLVRVSNWDLEILRRCLVFANIGKAILDQKLYCIKVDKVLYNYTVLDNNIFLHQFELRYSCLIFKLLGNRKVDKNPILNPKIEFNSIWCYLLISDVI